MAYITMCDAKRLQCMISFLMYSRREMYQLWLVSLSMRVGKWHCSGQRKNLVRKMLGRTDKLFGAKRKTTECGEEGARERATEETYSPRTSSSPVEPESVFTGSVQ